MGHPAGLEPEVLLSDCDVKRTRGGGPGGQHRNRVDTAVTIRHRPTGIRAEASERRSQEQNRRVAVFRLRLKLAVEHREDVPLEGEPSELWKSRCRGGKVAVNLQHKDYPTVLAEALDVLRAYDMDTKAAAEHLGCSASQLVKLIKSSPAAFTRLNRHRREHGQRVYR